MRWIAGTVVNETRPTQIDSTLIAIKVELIRSPGETRAPSGDRPIALWAKKPTKKLMRIANKNQLMMFAPRFG